MCFIGNSGRTKTTCSPGEMLKKAVMLLLRNVECLSLLCNVWQSERMKVIGSETIAFRAADVVDRSSRQEPHVSFT
jgi:hypothetical protein